MVPPPVNGTAWTLLRLAPGFFTRCHFDARLNHQAPPWMPPFLGLTKERQKGTEQTQTAS